MLTFLAPFRSSSSKAGFTLIELLVVCFIIAVLFAIVIQNLITAQIKTRDAQRLKDLDTIQAAVEQYYRDTGHYPITKCSNNASIWASFDSTTYKPTTICPTVNAAGVNTLGPELASYFVDYTKLKDPLPPSSTDAGYLYRSDDGANYCILVWRTPENMNNFPANRYMHAGSRCAGGVNSSGQCMNGSGVVDSSNNLFYGVGTLAGSC
ncbi:MAG: ral secretion pathway protein [Patescibacteria group bacterium]|nr:ral secretion pathway protein [Patescibacteria group bacterium]